MGNGQPQGGALSQPKGWGKFYGVGVGPGDPQLLTLRAYNLLQRVPVVCVPQGSPGDASYTWNIISRFVDPNTQEVLHLRFPMTRDRQELAEYWGQAIEAIGHRLSRGDDCAFFTEGDPLLYSTFVHVYRLMRQRYPQVEVEIVPGVSSILAAAAHAQLPLANGEERLAILPATASPADLEIALSRFDCIVLIKVNRAVETVLSLLEKLNLLDKAVFVSQVTSPQEEIVRQITELRHREIDYMSLIIVRK